MAHVRRLCATVLSVSVLAVPIWSAEPAALGTVTSAQSAHIGTAFASVGSNVFGGDKLSTEATGGLQIRTASARFQLSRSSVASLGQTDGTPTATLISGTAIFSTASSKAFVLRASSAEIRPQSDAPTVAQVSVVGPKELLIRSTRGAVLISVDGETKVIQESSAYRVVIDPDAATLAAAKAAAPQGPRGAGTNGPGGPPIAPGQNRFVLFAIILTGVATGFALHAALESPDRP